MVEPLTGHPAADRVTPDALVVEQDRGLVPLSTWVADAAVVAAGAGRLLQILTPSDSRITYPLELMLAEGGAQWIVRNGTDGFRDGFTGVPMGWTGTRFTPVDGPVPEVDTARDPAAGSLEVQVSTLHPATQEREAAELELGATAVAVTRALIGADPIGWGTAEPATQPWSSREVTAFCRDRAPAPTSLVVVAGGPARRAVGRLQVRRVTTGVLEEVRMAGPAARAVGPDAIDRLAQEVAATARSMLVAVHPLRVDGARAAEPSPPAVPYGLLVGASVVGERGVEHARSVASPVRLLAAGPGAPACWCRLDGGPGAPFEQLSAVVEHFGLGGTGSASF